MVEQRDERAKGGEFGHGGDVAVLVLAPSA
jgi:hypothetical protein